MGRRMRDHTLPPRRGLEWVGPCPLCGGEDRFHVRDSGGRAAVGCHPDLFDSGLVSGSAAWHDGVRGVLSLQWRIGGASGARDLVCPKSNHGPARMVCGLDAIRDREPDGAIIGFEAAGVGWHTPARGG